jgi:hypothetical protein
MFLFVELLVKGSQLISVCVTCAGLLHSQVWNFLKITRTCFQGNLH